VKAKTIASSSVETVEVGKRRSIRSGKAGRSSFMFYPISEKRGFLREKPLLACLKLCGFLSLNC
jgi:hypothetical protein